MKVPRYLYFPFIILFAACTGNPPANEALDRARADKSAIDGNIKPDNLLVFAKIPGKKIAVAVENKRYPAKFESTFNVMKDKSGRIIYIAEMPYSETNDWFIAYRSYFDSTGNLFAFQKLNNFLKNKCVKGAAVEKITKFYNGKSQLLDSVYTLTDTNNKPLDASACDFWANFPYKVIPNLKDYKELKGLSDF